MRQLEERLGVRLLHRTTRSVSVTDAGLRLLERLRPAIDQIAGALEDLNQERQRPLGRLRIYATHWAAAGVIAPIWGRFLSTYPEVHLELAVGEALIDIVAKGFDAGIGPRDRAPADMIAVRNSEETASPFCGEPPRPKPPRLTPSLNHNSGCSHDAYGCNIRRAAANLRFAMAVDVAARAPPVARDNEHHADRDGQQPTAAALLSRLRSPDADAQPERSALSEISGQMLLHCSHRSC
jgi:DNA-binding transcriptional LysR family regulator